MVSFEQQGAPSIGAGRPLAVVVGVGDMGMAVARRFGQHHRLLLADLSAQRLDAVAAQLRAEGSEVETAVCDVTDADSVAALAQCVDRLGPLRALIHVAGLSPSLAPWQTILRVNLIGPQRMMAAMLERAVPGTAAIFVASLAGHALQPSPELQRVLAAPLAPDFLDRLVQVNGGEPSPGLSYSLSKQALIRLCRQQAPAWGARAARGVSVSPGMIATLQGRTEFDSNPAKRVRFEKTPLQRQGTLHEIVDAIEFLASERASFISGTDLLVDGGLDAATQLDGPTTLVGSDAG